MINYAIMSSPIGKLLLAKSTKGLNHIIFEHKIEKYETIIANNFPNQKIINDLKKQKSNKYILIDSKVYNNYSSSPLHMIVNRH